MLISTSQHSVWQNIIILFDIVSAGNNPLTQNNVPLINASEQRFHSYRHNKTPWVILLCIAVIRVVVITSNIHMNAMKKKRKRENDRSMTLTYKNLMTSDNDEISVSTFNSAQSLVFGFCVDDFALVFLSVAPHFLLYIQNGISYAIPLFAAIHNKPKYFRANFRWFQWYGNR